MKHLITGALLLIIPHHSAATEPGGGNILMTMHGPLRVPPITAPIPGNPDIVVIKKTTPVVEPTPTRVTIASQLIHSVVMVGSNFYVRKKHPSVQFF